jgi:hypothetical protein
MEVFATFGLIVLVGLAIPILILFSALLFDLAVVIYVVIASKGKRTRKPGTSGAVARYRGVWENWRTVIGWAH